MRGLCEEAGLPDPDRVEDHEDGGIVLFWDEQKLAVVVDPE